MVSPWKTGLGNSTFSKPRLPTVVPSVVSPTDSPTATPKVKRLLTSGLPNSALAAAWESLRSADGALQHLRIELAEQELAVGRRAQGLAPLRDDAAAQDGDDGPARHLPAFPRAVVRHVEVVLGERLLDRGVHQGEVRVAARRDHTFARVETKNLRGVGRRDVGEALERHAALAHALREGDAEARFRADVAARDILDRPPPELELEARRVLVGRQRGEPAVDQAVPERLLVLGELERGIGVRAEAARRLVVLGVEARVLVQRLAVDRQAEGPRPTDRGPPPPRRRGG